MNCVTFMMGGSGVRFGADIPKQYIEINGAPLFTYTLNEYSLCEFVDKYVIVSNPEWIDFTYQYAKKILGDKLYKIIPGGKDRSHSVKNGLICCAEFLGNDDYILIHDATNPFLEKNSIKKAIEAAKETGAAVVGTNQLHTIYTRNECNGIVNYIPRETVGSGYSPEIFRFSVIYPFYKLANDKQLEKMTSSIALTLQYGVEPRFIPADIVNIKITHPHDLEACKALIKYQSNIKVFK